MPLTVNREPSAKPANVPPIAEPLSLVNKSRLEPTAGTCTDEVATSEPAKLTAPRLVMLPNVGTLVVPLRPILSVPVEVCVKRPD